MLRAKGTSYVMIAATTAALTFVSMMAGTSASASQLHTIDSSAPLVHTVLDPGPGGLVAAQGSVPSGSGMMTPGTYSAGGNTFATIISGNNVARKSEGAHPNSDGAGNLTTNSTACQLTSGTGAGTNACYVGTTSEGPTTVSVGVSGSTVYRAVVAYPVSSVLPSDAAIVSASLYMVPNTSLTQTIQAYALTQAWSTGSVTWNSASTGAAWSTPGGSFDTTTPAFSGPSYQLKVGSRSDSVNISALVTSWLNTPSTNNGILLKQQNEAVSALAPLQFPSMVVLWSRRPGDDPAGSPQVHKITDQVSASVNVANENITVLGSVLALPGASSNLGLKLGYAMDLDGAPYLNFWEPSLALLINGDGSIRYTSADGYERQILHGESGWQSPASLNVTVSEVGSNLLTGNYTIRFNSTGLTNSYSYNTVSCGTGCSTPYTRLDSVKDPSGNAVTYHYNGTGQISGITDSEGRTITVGYPTTGITAMPQTLTDVASSRTWTFHYGAYNRLLPVDNPTGTSPSPTFGYLSGGYLSTILDPDGNKDYFGDSAWPHSNNAVAYAADAYWGLDSSGNTTSSTSFWLYQPTSTFGTPYTKDPNGGTTNYIVDNQDRITSVTDPLGHAQSTSWSSNSNVLTQTNALTAASTYGYDALNNITSVTSPAGAGTSSSRTFTYPSPSGGLADYSPTTAKDAQGNSTTYSYNGSNELATSTAAGGLGSTTNHYQGDSGISCTHAKPGQLCSTVNGIGATTSYTYDVAGDVATITPPTPLGAIGLSYNADGYLTARTDGRAQALYYSYDPLGRLTQVSTSTSSCTSSNCTKYSYNAEGSVTQRVDLSGTTSYTFDRQRRVLTLNTPTGNTSYSYDGDNNLTSYTDSGGTVGYGYDAASRLSKAWLPGGSCPAAPSYPNSTSCISFGYDNANRRTSTSYPNGQTIADVYDADGREQSITAKNSAGTVLASRTYNYVHGSADTDLRQSVTDQTGSMTTYGYNARNEVTSATIGGVASSWTYDNAGNRLTAATGSATIAFKYNSASELCYTATTNTAACGSTPSGGTGYTYNGAGDLTAASSGAPSAYGYSAFDQLSSTTTGGTPTSYGYSDTTSDQRTAVGSASYANGALGLTRETTSGTSTEYTREPNGTLLAMNRAGTVYYYTGDALGSVILLTNTSGAVSATYSYDAWGSTTSPVTGVAAQNPWRYASGYTDATGLIKFGTRYYNPAWGRFTQQDPTGQESNAYAYVGCNPVNAVDPSGRNSQCGAATSDLIFATLGLGLSAATLIVGIVAEIPSLGVSTVLGLIGVGGFITSSYGIVRAITAVAENC